MCNTPRYRICILPLLVPPSRYRTVTSSYSTTLPCTCKTLRGPLPTSVALAYIEVPHGLFGPCKCNTPRYRLPTSDVICSLIIAFHVKRSLRSTSPVPGSKWSGDCPTAPSKTDLYDGQHHAFISNFPAALPFLSVSYLKASQPNCWMWHASSEYTSSPHPTHHIDLPKDKSSNEPSPSCPVHQPDLLDERNVVW